LGGVAGLVAGLLEKVADSADGSSGTGGDTLPGGHRFNKYATAHDIIGKKPTILNTLFVIFRKILQKPNQEIHARSFVSYTFDFITTLLPTELIMLYLGIDLHKSQITVNLRNENGDVIQTGQICTDHDSLSDFFAKLVKRAGKSRGFMAIFEVCGFHDWLYAKLQKCGCKEIVVIQPDNSARQKTDRRDANALCELLWNNRKRLRDGARPNGIQRIYLPDATDAQVRQLVNLRTFLVAQRTKIINKVRGLLRKHNIEQDAPSQTRFGTQKNRRWLEKVVLPVADRIEVDIHLKLWKEYDEQVVSVEAKLAKYCEGVPALHRLLSIPGISAMGAITLLSRIVDITRFKTPDSLANYFGLTPGCRNSGEATQRLGSITKAGSRIARLVLNFAVNHVVRKCPHMKSWHKKIKIRRGAKTARVAVMRRLATIVWHILRWDKTYQFRYDPPTPAPKQGDLRSPKEVLGGIDNGNHLRIQEKTPLKCRGKTKA
jgi:transposase